MIIILAPQFYTGFAMHVLPKHHKDMWIIINFWPLKVLFKVLKSHKKGHTANPVIGKPFIKTSEDPHPSTTMMKNPTTKLEIKKNWILKVLRQLSTSTFLVEQKKV